MEDQELLRQFAKEGSQEAFAAFVRRNADWVYSVCRRRLGDAGLAEDAAQAVFLAAAQKAGVLCRQRAVGPWLHRAARFAAASIERERKRRARREQEVAAVKDEAVAGEARWAEMEAQVEPALDRLGRADREAIVLRFYQRKSHAEIALALRISEAAAQKRLGRALERLKALLAVKDGHLSVAAVSLLLSEHAVGPAPAGLAQLVASGVRLAAPAKAAMVQDILWRMVMTKVIKYVAVAVVLCLLSAGGYWWSRANGPQAAGPAENPSSVPAPIVAARVPTSAETVTALATASAPAPRNANELPLVLTGYGGDAANGLPALMRPRITPMFKEVTELPVRFANSAVFAYALRDERLKVDVDAAVTRNGGPAAGHLQFNSPLSICEDGVRSFAVAAEAFRGKRIVLSGWVQSREVGNQARLRLGIWDAEENLLVEGSTAYRDPITGTTDWKQYKIVADVPANASMIVGSVSVAGGGDIWVDGLQVDLARENEPTTDDQQWRLYANLRPLYELSEDMKVTHDNHVSALISTGEHEVPTDFLAIYGRVNRAAEPLREKRVQVTMWMKYENAESVTLSVWVWGKDQKILSREAATARKKGSGDWQQFKAVAYVPVDAQYVDYGLRMLGTGKVWVDAESAKMEVLEK